MKRSMQVVVALCCGALFVVGLMPRTAGAVAASLVQVVNTAANPVSTNDVDNPTRNAVSLICNQNFPPNSPFEMDADCYNLTSSNKVLGPQGTRFVADYVSGQIVVQNGATPVVAGLLLAHSVLTEQLYVPLTPQGSIGPYTYYAFSARVRGIGDASQGVQVFTQGVNPNEEIFLRASVEGHLVDCSTGCTPY